MNKRRKREIEEIVIDDDELDNQPAVDGVDEAIKKEIEKHLKDVKLEEVMIDKMPINSFDGDVFDKVVKRTH